MTKRYSGVCVWVMGRKDGTESCRTYGKVMECSAVIFSHTLTHTHTHSLTQRVHPFALASIHPSTILQQHRFDELITTST